MRFTKKRSETFDVYHCTFMGDTYDACARCGGKCEKFKISSLMPGEKEFMATKLGKTIPELEGGYLSSINTPYGNIDVLKLKNNCNFLDKEYRCTAGSAKPVLCDTYPVVFNISKGRVHFEIDQLDCPMVHWPEYIMAVNNFETNGIKAMKEMKIPFTWWKKVALFDEFDFDYVKIEQELAKTIGYEEFYLELLLGYACNGYERKAKMRGLALMIVRLENFSSRSEKQINKWTDKKSYYQKSIARMYVNLIKEQCNTMISNLRCYKNDNPLLNDSNNENYLGIIKEASKLLQQLQNHLMSFKSRLKEIILLGQRKSKANVSSVKLGNINASYQVGFPDDLPKLSYYQITKQGSKDFWQALALLSGTFFPNELDSPNSYYSFLNSEILYDGISSDRNVVNKGDQIWSKWIIVIAKDEKGRFVGVADGALIMNSTISIFYASHIATKPQTRNKGLGTLLSAAILQAAENNIPLGKAALGLHSEVNLNSGPLLSCDLGEVEFPDISISGASSIKRLSFHGRLGRKALWPFRYSQPDTNYKRAKFDVKFWNSVPMFLAYRSFNSENNSVQQAIDSAELLFSFFTASSGQGAEWNRDYMKKGILKDGPPDLIPFPTKREDVPGFIQNTGIFQDILKIFYPEHKYTRDLYTDK